MAERTIKHVSFYYYEPIPDPVREGETIYAERRVSRGETVDIPLEADIERGEKFDAFEKDEPEEGSVEEVTSIRDLSDVELIEWIKKDQPTVNEVLDAAEGDPELARRLLAAEDQATDGDSRKGVIQGLTHIVTSTSE